MGRVIGKISPLTPNPQRRILVWLLAANLACGGLAPQSQAGERTVEQILSDLDTVKPPLRQPGVSPKARDSALAKRSLLIKELARVSPENPRLLSLYPERWQTLAADPRSEQELRDELKQVMTVSSGKLAIEASYLHAIQRLRQTEGDPTPQIDEFIKRAPKDPRGAMLLSMGATRLTGVGRSNTLKRIVVDYPRTRYAEMAEGSLKQLEAIGKPFDWEFTDARNGSVLGSNALRGKVVVIDFWATWCGPCIAEMPRLKKLYAKYHDQGLEIVGVSLDQTIEPLKKFTQENQITWPQYFDGKVDSRTFADGWGIISIPSMFVLDRQGRLVTVNGRGELEALIPKLLEKESRFVSK